MDITSAALLECVRDHLPAPMIVREVRLVHAIASARASDEQMFAAPVVFRASRNGLVFDAAILDAHTSIADAHGCSPNQMATFSRSASGSAAPNRPGSFARSRNGTA